jgi:uncharacterized protein with HEPN domain
MPSRSPLLDIQYHIALAQEFASGFTLETFKQDRRTVYAVTHCPEIISESSRRLPDDLKARHPEIPWQQMGAAGNVYRHRYEDVVEQLIWDTVEYDLPALQTVVSNELGD